MVMKPRIRGIVWFRRDLRLADQPAFTAACKECDEVIPLFVFDEPLLQSHEFGSACVNFMLGCLDELQASLVALGLPLQWRRGCQVDEVFRAALEWEADVVYWNRDYEPSALLRDRAVQERLTREDIAVKTFKDHVVFEAEEVRGAAGEPMQRYSAYRARWWAKWHAVKPTVCVVPHSSTTTKKAVRSSMSPLPTANELGYEYLVPWIAPGEHRAREQLRWFVEGL
ncbi:MAG: deoxyribodipyrimidine photo-lyase, partial [Nitrospira sp.]|nr:deoxyribodipyrimidine photo-lyase [Nitrospira sp.]